MLFLLMHIPNPTFLLYFIEFGVPLFLFSTHFSIFLLLHSSQSFLSFFLSLTSFLLFCFLHWIHLFIHSVCICFSLWSVHLALIFKDLFLFCSLFSHLFAFLIYGLLFFLSHSFNSLHVFLLICESFLIVFLVCFELLSLIFYMFILVFLSLNCFSFELCSLLTNSFTIELINSMTDLSTHDSFHLLFYHCLLFLL